MYKKNSNVKPFFSTAVKIKNIQIVYFTANFYNNINPLNAELNPICHLLALSGAHHILHVSRIRVNNSLHRLPTRVPYPLQAEFPTQRDVVIPLSHPLISLKSSGSCLRLLPRLSVTYTLPSIFPSITCLRRQFLCKM